MTRQLIINGTLMDLLDNTRITLEYSSNIFEDPGKLSLTRSYTIKLPKTVTNTKVFDDPGNPGHASTMLRKYVSARYIQEGIDMIGLASAYLLKTTEEHYEVALVQSSMEALQALSQSKATLNDLADLPLLPWLNENGRLSPDYNGSEEDGALFAYYESGLGSALPSNTGTSTHPAMRLGTLLDKIFTQSGVKYEIASQTAAIALSNIYLLAAPNHKPNAAMDMEAGSTAGSVRYDRSWNSLYLDDFTEGWQPALNQFYGSSRSQIYSRWAGKYRLIINLKAPTSVSLSGVTLRMNVAAINTHSTSGVMEEWSFDNNIVQADIEIDLEENSSYYLELYGYSGANFSFSAADSSKPLLTAYQIHDTIDPSKDNRFPLEGNLPDISQWDFVKNCLALVGLSAFVKGDKLVLHDYSHVFDKSKAVDWSDKLRGARQGLPDAVSYTLQNWAKKNLIKYEENEDIKSESGVELIVTDETLKDSRDIISLAFQPSIGNQALHYKINNDGGADDEDIEPRIFTLSLGMKGRELYFGKTLQSKNLKSQYYAQLQKVVSNPVVISADIALTEIDLIELDLSRPVYLETFGHYYSINTIKTSDSGVSKVELTQIP